MAAELQELVATCKVHEIKELLKEFGKQDLDAKLLVECNEFGGRGSRSSLHNAAVRGRAEILALLLSTKANPNITDDAGTSPLHFAADLGHARVAFHLLQAGADPTLKNAFSSTPMDKLAINSWDASDTSEACIVRGYVCCTCWGSKGASPSSPTSRLKASGRSSA
eukprot:TRINITY_DN14346_c0_g1_i1.p1 TRINITY_DN14346_c0_g1~~TRINITY_DN14346_c0_g1_i1.p1  ORF type:complete len:166 (+),score=38.92 TRINITY_DN14346_c0_g1_i1:81-578(+)